MQYRSSALFILLIGYLLKAEGVQLRASQKSLRGDNNGDKPASGKRFLKGKSSKVRQNVQQRFPELGGGKGGKLQQGAVFTMYNSVNAPGNAIVIYDRSSEGFLTRVGTASTGGLGGICASVPNGESPSFPVDDPLGSQGALLLSDTKKCLLAVNAGSNTFSTFQVNRADFILERVHVMASHGSFPVSIAQHGDLVYLLNAGDDGSVVGFNFHGRTCEVEHIPGSKVSLGNDLRTPPFFVFSPSQVSFDPSGDFLLVVNKGSNEILTYTVDPKSGLLKDVPRSTTTPGNIPFSFTFDAVGHMLVTEAFGSSDIGSPNAGAVTSYSVSSTVGGTLTVVSESIDNGQTAACWLTYVDGLLFVSNNIASTLSTYEVYDDGSLRLLQAVAADSSYGGIAEPLDLAMTDDGQFLYVLNAHNTGETENPAPVTISYFKVVDGLLISLGETRDFDVVAPGSILEGPVGLAVI